MIVFGEKDGGKQGGSGGGETADTLNSRATAKIVEVISHGECVGLANSTNPLQSVYFNNTAAQNSDLTNNFLGLQVDQRTGLPDQDPFVGFSDTESQFVNGNTITHATPVIYTVTDNFINAVRMTIGIPALTEQDQSSGELTGSSVSYKFSSGLVSGGYTDVLTENLNAKCTTTQQLSYRIERPAAASDTDDWHVKVTRLTADATTVFVQNQIVLDSVTEIVDSNLQYADLACVALQIDSQQFGTSIPVRSFDFVGMVLDVPSNYTPPDFNNPGDPTKRVYTGLWDGTFKRAWSDNPAWILWTCLTDKTWGLGDSIDPSQIDKWGLYQIAQYCDEFVDDGTGTSTNEPRYTINTQITSAQDAYAMIQTIASVFHGMSYWGTGSVTFVADQPKDPVKIVTQTDVVGGNFTYQGAALKSRHSVVEVAWNDPSNNYTSTVDVVEDAALLNRFGWRPTQVTAFGCTSKGMATRFGRWVLETEANETETVTYETSFVQQDLRPGDIIAVYDPWYQGIRTGGRCTAISGTSLTIDASSFHIAAGKTYTLTMVGPDMRLIERTLTNSAGNPTLLTWTNTIAALPATSSTVTIHAELDTAAVQFNQIAALTTTSVTLEQSVALTAGVTYTLSIPKTDGTTVVRTLTTVITSGQQIGTSNVYELKTLSWSGAVNTVQLNGTILVSPLGEGDTALTVSSRTSTSCVVSASYTFRAGYTYTATFVLPDGSSISRQLTNSAGSTTTLTWGQALDDLPIVGSMYAITVSDLTPRQFRVISVKEKEANIFEVTALLYNPDKYDAIEDGLLLAPPQTSSYLSGKQPDPVTDLTAARNPIVQPDGTYVDMIQVMWTPSEAVLVNTYLVSYQFETNPWVKLPNSMGTSAAFKSNGPGNYTFKVVAQTFMGVQSVATTVTLTLNNSRPFNGATITNIRLQT